MNEHIMERIIMFLCRVFYRKFKKPIFYIKGKDKDYPRYLLYTEDEKVYQRMDDF